MLFLTIKNTLLMTLILLLSLLAPLILADHKTTTEMHRPSIVPISNLAQLATLAKKRQLPILLLFSTEGCPYCEQIKEEFLVPMLISGEYTHRVIIRELEVADETDIIDFSGKKITSYAFSRRYKVRLFPTTAFIDHQGTALTENIIGINTPSLFGGTLDDHIDDALSLVKGQSPLQ
ncbi:thioredoxin family protein [sulfur-oxidizing endosymbiont of Gigantopelta aegis]|uniref:thioredoxin family protein n=1 Tax=sulfur-oxidizing endosymbiont of Gigantopelta aegis TaxID=2794934 RepID=UPI0018DDD9B6|nr:thioredoxin fold domain-containing protein [sulfur-oxidizing endosymbiont of Gigantopelta aegis]